LLSASRGDQLMEPFRAAQDLTKPVREVLRSGALTKSRQSRLSTLDGALEDSPEEAEIDRLALRLLNRAAFKRYELLTGRDSLVVNERVANTVATLTGVHRQRGLLTDTKLELSRLVGTGPESALRMASILAMNDSEADELRAALA
jgi:hypothetical protein